MSRFVVASILIFTCFLDISFQRSTPLDDSYVAAVIEFEVTKNSTAALQDYIHYIEAARKQNADIIVFPELTVTNGDEYVTIPINGSLREHPIPALKPDLYDSLMVSISKAARDNQIYVVINVQERVDCNDAPGELCPEKKVYLFNANVVFDRTGAVIDRYRKINLYGEFTRTPALENDLGLFDTDFGVRFGHFICFDLLFQIPAIQVVEKHNITDVIFTTMWFSELPFLTAVQIQEAYAFSMNVNFLASGANNVQVGSAGSGIYSGRAGALVSTMPRVPTTRLLVARVPKVPGKTSAKVEAGPIYDTPAERDSLLLRTDPSFPSHVSRLLAPGFQEFTLAHDEVSCKFTVRLTSGTAKTAYKYRAVAFSGVRTFDGDSTAGVKICAVVFCTGESITTCGRRFENYEDNSTANFDELLISATMPSPTMNKTLSTRDSVLFPLSLTASIMPLEPSEFYYNNRENDSTAIYDFNLLNKNAKLYTFGLWSRVFGLDRGEPTQPVDDSDTESTTSSVTESDSSDTTTDSDSTPTTPDTGSSTVHILETSVLLLTLAIIKLCNK